MLVNHIGPVFLTTRLLPLLQQDTGSPRTARIVNVASRLEKMGQVAVWCEHPSDACGGKPYSTMKAYGTSKQANLHFTYELSRRLAGQPVCVNAVTPGMVNTQLGRFHWWYPLTAPLRWALLRSPAHGALPSVHCAADPDMDGVSGKYFGATKDNLVEEVLSSEASQDAELSKVLWDRTEKLLEFMK